MPALVTAWSSTTRTRTGSVVPAGVSSGRRARTGSMRGSSFPIPASIRGRAHRRAIGLAPPYRRARGRAALPRRSTGARSNPAPSSCTRRVTPVGEYTRPTRTDVAWACRIAFVRASCAIRNSVWATSGAGTVRPPAVTRRASITPVRFAHATRARAPPRASDPPVATGRARGRSAGLLEDGLRRGPGLRERRVRVVGRPSAMAPGPPEAPATPTRALARPCRAPRAPSGSAPPRRPRRARSIRPPLETRVGDRDRGVLGEQLEQFGILVDERPAGVAGEHHPGADDVPAPPDGDADHALERLPVLGTDVPARTSP